MITSRQRSNLNDPIGRELMALVRYLAKKRVKQQLEAKGFRVQSIEPLAFSRLVKAYLEQHLTELITEAKTRLRR